jgi:hypothetical protein
LLDSIKIVDNLIKSNAAVPVVFMNGCGCVLVAISFYPLRNHLTPSPTPTTTTTTTTTTNHRSGEWQKMISGCQSQR